MSFSLDKTVVATEHGVSLDTTVVTGDEKNGEDLHPETGEPLPSYEEACMKEWERLNEDPHVTQARKLLAKAQEELAKTKQELAKNAKARHPESGEPLPPYEDPRE